MRYGSIAFSAAALISGVKSARSSCVTPWRSNAFGFVGNGCVLDARSPGTSLGGTGRSSNGQTGVPVVRSNAYANACFVSCTTAFTGRPSTVRSIRIGAVGLSQS